MHLMIFQSPVENECNLIKYWLSIDGFCARKSLHLRDYVVQVAWVNEKSLEIMVCVTVRLMQTMT